MSDYSPKVYFEETVPSTNTSPAERIFPINQQRPESQYATASKTSSTESDPPRWLTISLQILAYGIPLTFLVYVLYINFLPFGYNKTFTIDVGSANDTNSGQVFYLEPSPDLSETKTDADGTTYRELNGLATAVFKPGVVLEDAEITVEVEGDGVSIIPPVIDFDPDSVAWDYEWDFRNERDPLFTKVRAEAVAEWENYQVPDLQGNTFWFDGGMYFDGTSRLELPNSANKFEAGPFTMYVEWTPENRGEANQQIIGHYNWEIYQNPEAVSFSIRTLNEDDISINHKIDYKIQDNFFNKKHSLLAVYEPSEAGGYIALFVNNKLVGQTYIGTDKIDRDYNQQRNLSLGKSGHGNSDFFSGKINRLYIAEALILTKKNKYSYTKSGSNYIPLYLHANQLSDLESNSLTLKN